MAPKKKRRRARDDGAFEYVQGQHKRMFGSGVAWTPRERGLLLHIFDNLEATCADGVSVAAAFTRATGCSASVAYYGGTGIKLDPLPGASSVPGWFGGCAWRSLRSECVRACAEGCDGCAGTLHRARGRDSEVEPELYSGFLENHEKS